MSPPQHRVLVLLGIVASVGATTCPPCYTHTVTGFKSCPELPVAEEPCFGVPCFKVVTATIPGPNPACAVTPTVTRYAACPTAASCRGGCSTRTKTVTGTSEACGVSWETGAPSNTASVTWDKRQDDPEPTGEPDEEPIDDPGDEDPDDGPIEIPLPPGFTPPNSIGIQPPKATVSWGKRQDAPQPTGEPTDEPVEDPSDEPVDEPIDEEPQDPDDGPIDIPFFPPGFNPPNSIGIQPPKYTVSWGKRDAQKGAIPEPTGQPLDEPVEEPEDEPIDEPEDEEPEEGPIDIPFFPPGYSPPNSIGIQPPKYTISWGKRVAIPEPTGQPSDEPVDEPVDEPSDEEPEDEPEDEEPEEGPIDIPFFPPGYTPPNSIGLQPPKATVIWGKREPQGEDTPEPEPTDDPSDEEPTGPIEISLPPVATPSNSIGIQPPQPSISWGKREAQKPSFGLVWPTRASVSWDKPPKKTTTGGYVSWGKRTPPKKTIGLTLSSPKPKPTTTKKSTKAPVKPTTTKAPVRPTTTKAPALPTPTTTSGGYLSWGKREPQKDTIGLTISSPPSVSWESPPKPTRTRKTRTRKPRPTPTKGPVKPTTSTAPLKPTTTKAPVLPTPTTTDGNWVSWDKREAQENTIGLTISSPPSVSWELPPKPTRTRKTRKPKPTTTSTGNYISWGKREPQDTIGLTFTATSSVTWDLPPKPTKTKKTRKPKPTKTTTDGGYASWGKRDPQITLPPGITIPNSIGIQPPPKPTISWGKREPEAQGDSIGFQPPKQTIGWGKREPEAQDDSVTFEPPSETISWGKREDADSIGIVLPTGVSFSWNKPKTTGGVIWGKREPQFTLPPGVVIPSIPNSIGNPVPTRGYMSWGRRDAAPEPTAAAVLDELVEPSKKCLLTTTVARYAVPCPLILCPLGCPIPAPAEPYNPDDVVAQGEPSPHQSFDCPVTVTSIKKCPGCGPCATPSLKTITLPRPTTARPTTAPPITTVPVPTTVTFSIPKCPTKTVTVARTCTGAPRCPDALVACAAPTALVAREPELEKRLTCASVTPTVTKQDPPCPTYTCIPGGYCPL